MTSTLQQPPEPQSRRWTREEYYELAELGWFRGQRVLLLEGEIIQMPPQGAVHARVLSNVNRWLHDAYDQTYTIRIQMPLNCLENSDPEPDAAVVAESESPASDHPSSALLVIEVSDSSLRLDRRKAALYAEAGVTEYWIVNLSDRQIEINRDVDRDARKYRFQSIFDADQLVAPTSRPQCEISFSKLRG